MRDRFWRSTDKLSRLTTSFAGFRRNARKEVLKSLVKRCWNPLCILAGWFAIASLSAEAADPNNILLDFSATWCGPCRQMVEIVSKLERQGFPIRKVDVDAERELANRFNVDSIPCFVLIVNGREVNRIVGPTEERELRRLLMMLPKQNIDEALVGKSPRNNAQVIPTSNSGSKASDDKKSFLRIPPLFPKSHEKNSELALTPTSVPDTVRGQNPGRETSVDGFARDPLMTSTRIRVKDGSRVHYGSGTVIDSQPGRSVIVTCGHIFRDLGKEAVVEVDVFTGSNSNPQMVIGQILRFDLKADIGLLAIPTQQPLPIIKLASIQDLPSARDRVSSIGCGGGERPTREEHVITSVNKYLGPDNLECSGVPQQGRSGGGLFLGSELIGVCIAADPKEKRGIYTGMKPIVELLRKSKLGHLIPSLVATDESLADSSASANGLGDAVAFNEDSIRRADDDVASLIEAATRGTGGSPSAPGDYVGSEIICIVRPKTPGAMSRVVIVNQASSRFVDDLLHESSGARSDSTATVQTKPGKKPLEKRLAPAAETIETSFEIQRERRH